MAVLPLQAGGASTLPCVILAPSAAGNWPLWQAWCWQSRPAVPLAPIYARIMYQLMMGQPVLRRAPRQPH